jgi:hypothetical protein
MSKRVAIVQSCYVPWKGYFDLINQVDHFLIYDDAEYSKNTWRNRNRIKTANGTQWLTIPVLYSSNSRQRIDDVEVSDARWAHRHWKTIRQNYVRAPHFDGYEAALAEVYLQITERRLSAINRIFIDHLCSLLGITTTISWTSDVFSGDVTGTRRLVELCAAVGADSYLSGPAAQAYLDLAQFEQAGIEVVWMNYDGYPTYPQLHPPFEHAVTTLDLLFSVGSEAPRYMKSFNLQAP